MTADGYVEPGPGTARQTPQAFTVEIPAGFNVFQCSGMWGFGHRCSLSHGHTAWPCTCACGDKQPPLSQCPNSPGMVSGTFLATAFPVGAGGHQ